MARNTVGPQTDEGLAAENYQPNYQPAPYTAPDVSRPAPAPDSAIGTRATKKKPTADHQPERRSAKSRLDEWMEVDFKFGGSRIKRKAVALVLLGAPAVIPLFLMLPALMIPYIDRFHSMMLFWLKPSRQIRPPIYSLKQNKLRKRRVIRYAMLYFVLLVVFVGLLIGPLFAKDHINFTPPSQIAEFIQPVGFNNNDTRGYTQTGTGAGGEATQTDANGNPVAAATTTSAAASTSPPGLEDRRRRVF